MDWCTAELRNLHRQALPAGASPCSWTARVPGACFPPPGRSVGCAPATAYAQLRCPVIAIGADHDAISPLPDLAAFAQAVPAVRTVVLEGTGHMVMLERPDAFNTEITRFLDRLPREGETAPADPAPSPGRTQPQQDRPGQTRRMPGNDSTP